MELENFSNQLVKSNFETTAKETLINKIKNKR